MIYRHTLTIGKPSGPHPLKILNEIYTDAKVPMISPFRGRTVPEVEAAGTEDMAHVVILDIDRNPPGTPDEKALYVLESGKGYTKDGEQWVRGILNRADPDWSAAYATPKGMRLIYTLSRPVLISEYEAAVQYASRGIKDLVDPASFSKGQRFFVPRFTGERSVGKARFDTSNAYVEVPDEEYILQLPSHRDMQAYVSKKSAPTQASTNYTPTDDEIAKVALIRFHRDDPSTIAHREQCVIRDAKHRDKEILSENPSYDYTLWKKLCGYVAVACYKQSVDPEESQVVEEWADMIDARWPTVKERTIKLISALYKRTFDRQKAAFPAQLSQEDEREEELKKVNEELAKARPSESSYAAALGTEYIAPPKISGRDVYLLREPTKGRWHVWDGHNGVFDPTTYDMEDIIGANGCYKAAAVREMGIGTLTREIVKKDANGPYPTREPRRTGEILSAVGASLGNTANSFSADYTLDVPCVLTADNGPVRYLYMPFRVDPRLSPEPCQELDEWATALSGGTDDLRNWLSHIADPKAKVCAMLIHAASGTGKNTLADGINKVFLGGNHVIKPTALFSRFNTELIEARVIHIDEETPMECKDIGTTLKQVAGENDHRIEVKGGLVTNNKLNIAVLITTNKSNIVSDIVRKHGDDAEGLEAAGRRVFMIKPSEEHQKKAQECIRAFHGKYGKAYASIIAKWLLHLNQKAVRNTTDGRWAFEGNLHRITDRVDAVLSNKRDIEILKDFIETHIATAKEPLQWHHHGGFVGPSEILKAYIEQKGSSDLKRAVAGHTALGRLMKAIYGDSIQKKIAGENNRLWQLPAAPVVEDAKAEKFKKLQERA